MRDEEHRFDTVRLEKIPKHAVPGKKRRGFPGRGERRFPRWGYRVILILCLSVLAVLGWYNRRNLTPQNIVQWVEGRVVGFGIGDGYPKSIAGSSVSPQNFLSSDKNLVVAGDTALSVYNSTAKEIYTNPHSYAKPTVKAKGSRFLLYNLGGKNFRIDTLGGKSVSLSPGQDILGGALAPDGQTAVVTAADGYCGMLVSYTAEGNVQSRYWFSSYYPCAVALSPDGLEAAVAGVSAKNGELVSALYLINLNQEKSVEPAATLTGNLILDVFWDSPSTVTAVGDSGVLFLNPKSGKKSEFRYEGQKLEAFASDSGRTALALCAYPGAEESSLTVLGNDGAGIFSSRVSGSVRSVSLYGQELAALADGKAWFFPLAAPAGSEKGISAGEDARAVALRDESSAYVLGISEIRLLKIR